MSYYEDSEKYKFEKV